MLYLYDKDTAPNYAYRNRGVLTYTCVSGDAQLSVWKGSITRYHTIFSATPLTTGGNVVIFKTFQ